MTIVGRITKDAVVSVLKDDRKVVNFSVAVNDQYKPKDGDAVKPTTYYNCAYWISDKIADKLKKGTLVELVGRLYVTAYMSVGEAKASLNCHVNSIKIHAWPREAETGNVSDAVTVATDDVKDDLPF